MTKARVSERPKLQSLKPATALVNTSVAQALAGGTGEDRSWRADKRSSTARGYTYKWQQASKGFLKQHPLCQCEDCQEGTIRVREATVVDHRIPHRGDMTLFWDRSNWQAMTAECHNRKTQRESLADRGVGST